MRGEGGSEVSVSMLASTSVLMVVVDVDVDAIGTADVGLFCGIDETSSFAKSILARSDVAEARLAGVRRDMTPRVRWRVVRGRIADGGNGNVIAVPALVASVA